MNQKKCQYFVALAEEMNFTKASESLHITQQSLSGSIKRLEEEYGVELFSAKTISEAHTCRGDYAFLLKTDAAK